MSLFVYQSTAFTYQIHNDIKQTKAANLQIWVAGTREDLVFLVDKMTETISQLIFFLSANQWSD